MRTTSRHHPDRPGERSGWVITRRLTTRHGEHAQCDVQKCTFGQAGRSAGKHEVRRGILIHDFRVILSRFFDGTNEIIERPFPFHLSFKNEDPI